MDEGSPGRTRRGWTLYSRERVRLGHVSVCRIDGDGHWGGSSVGPSSQYAAVANMSNGTTENVTTTATWTSSNQDIATVSAGGLVTATAEGTVSISATFDNVTGAAQAAVLPAQAP